MIRACRAGIVLAMLAASFAAAACGGDPDSGAAGERGSNHDGIRPDPAINELVERCAWESGGGTKVPADEIREAFVRADEEPVSLLVSGTEFRPGEQIDFALDNRTGGSLDYGLGRGLRDAETGADMPDGVDFVPAVGLFLEPREVGYCMSVELPNSMPPGRYVVYVASVEIGDDSRDVEAEVTVAGEPVTEAERVPAGVIEPATDPVEVLWHPDGDDATIGSPEDGDGLGCDRKVKRTVRMWELVEALDAALATPGVEWWIDRSTCPPTYPVVVPHGGSEDVSAFFEAAGGEREAARSRVALTSVPFTSDEFRTAVSKVEEILEREGHDRHSWAHSGIQGDATLDLDFTELEVAVKQRLDAEVEVPIRYHVQSGP